MGERRSDDRAGRPPPREPTLTTAEFVAAVNLRRPKGAKPLTRSTASRLLAAGAIARFRPGKRVWRIPESEVARFVREHHWRPER